MKTPKGNESEDRKRRAIRENYAKVAFGSGCGCNPSCCNTDSLVEADTTSIELGYSKKDLKAVPDGANMGLGCGNPHSIASLRAGDTVLDLGCGGGFDCFLAAERVGESGYVIGVDMTPEMITKARENVRKSGFKNIDIRLGEIEHLPVDDGSVDVIISNCVINLSTNKQRVYSEAFRVLRKGGYLAISDVITFSPLPESIKQNLEFHSLCISGASSKDEVVSMLQKAGFEDVVVQPREESRMFIKRWAPGSGVENYVVSADIRAVK